MVANYQPSSATKWHRKPDLVMITSLLSNVQVWPINSNYSTQRRRIPR